MSYRILFLLLVILTTNAFAQRDIFGGNIPQSGQSLSGLILPANTDMIALDNDGDLWRRPGRGGLNFKKDLPVRGVVGQLIGIDYRPADGRLYGLDDLGNIYVIDTSRPNLATATLISTPPVPFINGLPAPFNGGVQSLFDFNPVVDAIRLIGSNDQNYAVVNSAGNLNVLAAQTRVTYANGDVNGLIVGPGGAIVRQPIDPNIVGGAYTNNVNGATVTIFYALDFGTDSLVTIAQKNAAGSSNTGGGQLQTIGNIIGANGFPLNITPTADCDIYTDANGNNTLIGFTGRTLFTIDLAQIAPLNLGQVQQVIARSVTIPDGGFIDIAVRSYF